MSEQSKELVDELRGKMLDTKCSRAALHGLCKQAAARIEYLERCRCELTRPLRDAVALAERGHTMKASELDPTFVSARSALSRCSPAIEREWPSMCDPLNDPSSDISGRAS